MDVTIGLNDEIWPAVLELLSYIEEKLVVPDKIVFWINLNTNPARFEVSFPVDDDFMDDIIYPWFLEWLSRHGLLADQRVLSVHSNCKVLYFKLRDDEYESLIYPSVFGGIASNLRRGREVRYSDMQRTLPWF